MKLSRRHFLSTSAFAGAFTFIPSIARAASPNGDLRVCLIGFNSRGKGLAGELLKCTNAKLVALCDVDSAVLDSYAAELETKHNIKVTKFSDYRKACESKEIDAVIIATPNHTHSLIATTAAANGKHAYVEKPVSHNVWEGRQLANSANKYKVIIQHGFQRRSETAWHEAYDFIKSGAIGKVKLARGFCYKPRPSIGKVAAPKAAPATVNYDLWCGPREVSPIHREKFHYDWHWQFDYGNGDLGNQGPHQLDVCRMFTGDPKLPTSVISVGARLGYQDDGQWANTQMCYFDYPVPIIFEVRGLPTKPYKDHPFGNLIECEGGYIAGGHGPKCDAFDKDGKIIQSFQGSKSHMQSFVDSCHSGKIDAGKTAESGHLSSALAHVGNISWKLGTPTKPAAIREAISNNIASDAFARMLTHLEDNKVDPEKDLITLGKNLTIDPEKEIFTGPDADLANPLLKGSYRKGFEINI
ncbi:MAG: Gfo/Idh/MocA family protein [Akkermansiaceae bacterium]|jgi:predicted dehydrogenase|nr:Gfo/Idh/MocA family oxidoreductase [Luteolibacter sp.]